MKQSEVKGLSTSDIQERIKTEKAALLKLKLGHAVSPIENPMTIRANRKTIARLSAELRQRELATKS